MRIHVVEVKTKSGMYSDPKQVISFTMFLEPKFTHYYGV